MIKGVSLHHLYQEPGANMKEVSKVGIFSNGKYLMGIRQDTGKWTEPGGHLHPKEDPLKGAQREVREETGLTLSQDELRPLGSKEVTKPDGSKIMVHAFQADLAKEKVTTVAEDPDKEVFGWNWIPVKGGKLPGIVDKNLHVPAKDNVLHFFLGFEKNAFLKRLIRVKPSEQTRAFILEVPGQTAQTFYQIDGKDNS